MQVLANLKYSSTDEWVKMDGNVATIGITDYAQSQLSDIVYVEIKVSEGEKIEKNSPLATLESVKAAADVNAPIGGKVVAANDGLGQTPEMVNSDPFGAAWMVKLEISNPAELDSLMDAAAYEKYCEGRGH
ncbi:MAG TPA: glycine cleavage system protein GcvH [Anaerolineaceae bacterium]|nr:glycine cleavage system protein GcvH [Anaerolineaceae bacterium]